VLRLAGAARNREAEMTEPGAVLEAAHTAISDLAAVLVAVRVGLGGECVRAGSHLEMAEIDLLSARDALEKARLEIDLAGPAVADVRVEVPLGVGSLRARHPRALPSTAVPRWDPDRWSGAGLGRGDAGPRATVKVSCSRYTTSLRVPCS
jgi:hypothetical protein